MFITCCDFNAEVKVDILLTQLDGKMLTTASGLGVRIAQLAQSVEEMLTSLSVLSKVLRLIGQ
jgi:hypothetical protein